MNHDCHKTVSVLRHGVLLIGCPVCINSPVQQGDSAAFYRRAQQVQYRRELVQPNQPEQFVKAHGVVKAREFGYSEDQIRKYS